MCRRSLLKFSCRKMIISAWAFRFFPFFLFWEMSVCGCAFRTRVCAACFEMIMLKMRNCASRSFGQKKNIQHVHDLRIWWKCSFKDELKMVKNKVDSTFTHLSRTSFFHALVLFFILRELYINFSFSLLIVPLCGRMVRFICTNKFSKKCVNQKKEKKLLPLVWSHVLQRKDNVTATDVRFGGEMYFEPNASFICFCLDVIDCNSKYVDAGSFWWNEN